MEPHERRIAENENLFREANEKIEQRSREAGVDAEQIPFVCECYDAECAERLLLTLGEYEAARRDPAQFIVAHGHTRPDAEQIIEVEDRYLVVRKTGAAGEAAADLEREP